MAHHVGKKKKIGKSRTNLVLKASEIFMRFMVYLIWSIHGLFNLSFFFPKQKFWEFLKLSTKKKAKISRKKGRNFRE